MYGKTPVADAGICKVCMQTEPKKEVGGHSCQYLGGVAAQGSTVCSVKVVTRVQIRCYPGFLI